MPVRKTAHADLRRRYPLHVEIGLALALGVVVLAFTVPAAPAEADPGLARVDGPILLSAPIPPTAHPPPPLPPAPPPPIEIPDGIEVEDEVLGEITLSLTDSLAVAPRLPAVAAPAPVPPPPPPSLPPPPGVVDPPDRVFDFSEVQPELIGGLAGLQGRVEYPEFARRARIEGQVVVQFVVDERGNVVDPVVLRSPNDLLSEAALKAVRESRFTPGQQRGRPVKVRFAVPVTFRLR